MCFLSIVIYCMGFEPAIECEWNEMNEWNVRDTAPAYVANECTLVPGCRHGPLQSGDSWTCMVKGSRNQFDNRCFATAIGQRCGTVCLNSFGNRTSLSYSLNDRLKHLRLVNRATAACG